MPSGGDFWLLRVSINMDILQKLISNLEIGSQDDVFLINKQLILQTNSKYFGNALEPLKLNIIIERESDRIKIYDVELNKKNRLTLPILPLEKLHGYF